MNNDMQGLLDIMAALRDPERGCPWDREQTFRTILPYTIEETYEVADAIEREDMEHLRDELGDLLFQVVFYARMAEEQGSFCFADIVAGICDKLERRHPHVFADETITSAAEQSRAWERHKQAERDSRQTSGVLDTLLSDIPAALPALMRAEKLHRRVATVGFDWPDIHGVLDKLDEELGEVREVIDEGQSRERLQDEIGDLLFVTTILARHGGIDSETALRQANAKFERRFRSMEKTLQKQGKDLYNSSLQEMDDAWDVVKAEERSGDPHHDK